jgi:FkbM family methyltransferase
MLSSLTLKLHKLAKAIEDPILFKVKSRKALPNTYEGLKSNWFTSLGIDTILDIGANVGQFSQTLSLIIPGVKIYAFEPIPDCFETLKESFISNSNIVAFNIGLGDESGKIPFEKNNISVCSSFLKMADSHKEAFAFTSISNSIDVEIAKLDDVVKGLNIGNSLLVKIDVQGYEDKVIKGGCQTIKMARIVIIETSFVPLYEKQPLFHDIYVQMVDMGFSLAGFLDDMSDPKTGKILQGDAIFMK